jgi:4-amino-4-deoxy-L-arabinose transferase-like glycosyltransferase
MKNTKITQKQVTIITSLLGLAFAITNLLTIKWYPLPWGDEVQFTDPVANYILTGHYYNTSWTNGSIYPPLYQMVLMGWLKIFGFSQFTVRSLNIFIAFVTIILLFVSLYKYRIIKKKDTLIIAVLALLSTSLLSWMAKSGRPDMLTMLIVVLLFLAFYYFKNNKSIGLVLLAISSIFAPISGLQIIPFMVFILIWSWITFKSERKLIFKFSIISFSGVIIGTIAMMFYFYKLNLLEDFILFILYMSNTFQKILHLLPINFFQFDNITVTNPSVPLLNKIIAPLLMNKVYSLCMTINAILIIFLYTKKMINHKSVETSLFIFALCIPLLMSLIAGHYPYYYSWIGLIISLILLILITEKYSKKAINYTFIVLGVIILLHHFPYTYIKYGYDKKNYPNVTSFINKHKISKSDYVLSCYEAYYDVRIKTANVYFNAYALLDAPAFDPNKADLWQNIKSKINYIIYNPRGGRAAVIQHRMEELENYGRTVTLIDSLATPRLYFFKVEDNIHITEATTNDQLSISSDQLLPICY